LHSQAEHLVARGHYAAARRLLHRARTLARASDHPEAEARSLLVEAMAQSRANDFSGAIMLIQQAQRIGGRSVCGCVGVHMYAYMSTCVQMHTGKAIGHSVRAVKWCTDPSTFPYFASSILSQQQSTTICYMRSLNDQIWVFQESVV